MTAALPGRSHEQQTIGPEQLADRPRLKRASARRERRLGIGDRRNVAKPAVPEMRDRRRQKAAPRFGSRLRTTRGPHPRVHEGAQQPGPDRAVRDINIGQVGKVFGEDGRLLDDALVRRSDRFIRELIWMARVLRLGPEQVTIDEEAAEAAQTMPCPSCGTPMTHHADKVVAAAATSEGDAVVSAHACGACGASVAVQTTH